MAFKQLLRAFDPQYELPSCKYPSNTAILVFYYKMHDEVVSEVSWAEFFSTTTDLWSSNAMQPHINYTFHFIGEDWKLHSYCLQRMFCPEDHTGDDLAAALQSSQQAWNLQQEQQS